jgi:hypothetical protein
MADITVRPFEERGQVMKRSNLVVAFAASLFALPSQTSAQWWNPFAPADYEECSEQAAKEAKTDEALTILLRACNSKFPARRNPNGKGYIFIDLRLKRSFQVDGPVPTAQDIERIEHAYQEYLAQKRQDEQRNAEEAQRRAEEVGKEIERTQRALQESLVRQRQDEQRRAEQRRKEVERKAAALPNVQIVDSKVSCTSSYWCGSKYGTVVVKNASAETVTRINLGWTIYQGNERTKSCTSHHETKKSISLSIPAGATASFNFETSDGPSDGAYRYCIMINDIEIDTR